MTDQDLTQRIEKGEKMPPKKSNELMATVVMESQSGKPTKEIAKLTGKSEETIRRYKRTAEFKAFEGRYSTKIDSIIDKVFIRLMGELDKDTPESARIARDLWNGIVPKTIGGLVKASDEETTSLPEGASLDDLKRLMGGDTIDAVGEFVENDDPEAESEVNQGSTETEST
jgi:hypothetical protein